MFIFLDKLIIIEIFNYEGLVIWSWDAHEQIGFRALYQMVLRAKWSAKLLKNPSTVKIEESESTVIREAHYILTVGCPHLILKPFCRILLLLTLLRKCLVFAFSLQNELLDEFVIVWRVILFNNIHEFCLVLRVVVFSFILITVYDRIFADWDYIDKFPIGNERREFESSR